MKKMSKTKSLTTCALLIATAIILTFFKIPISQIIEISFAMIPVALAGIIFGPIVGAGVGAISDILGYFVKPTGTFFPGFTLSAALTGVVFGLILKNRFTIPRVIIASIIYMVLVGVVLKSIWLSILYGNAFITLVPVRITKEAVMIPINVVLITVLGKALQKAHMIPKVNHNHQ